MDCLAQSMRHQKAEFIAYLSEVGQRQLHLSMGFSSLYDFCLETFKLSEGAVYRRIQVAKVVGKYPFVLDYLARGSLTLTNISLLCPHLTGKNANDILEACRGLTRKETEIFISKSFGGDTKKEFPQNHHGHLDIGTKPFDREEAYSEALVEYRFYAGKDFALKLANVRTLVGRKKSFSKDLESIFTFLMEHFLESKSRTLGTVKPHPSGTQKRYVPLNVRMELLRRADYRCMFVGENGRRCQETDFLEVDHVVPFGQGGKTSIENLQILCRSHNRYKAFQDYGAAYMARFSRK